MEQPGAAVLSAVGLSRRFGDRVALRDVSFQLRAGELTAVIGPNGAGKTTLLSILAGALTPSSGRVETARPGAAAAGVPGAGVTGAEATGPAAPQPAVGWVPQQPALYSKLSVLENLRLFARLQRVPDPEAAVGAMLTQSGLAQRAGEQVSKLSGGNRQRVNIAVGLLAQPAVLLLDEPSASLDPRQRSRLWEFVAELADCGTSVLYSTHDVHEASRHADRVLALDDGSLVFDGAPEAMDWSY